MKYTLLSIGLVSILAILVWTFFSDSPKQQDQFLESKTKVQPPLQTKKTSPSNPTLEQSALSKIRELINCEQTNSCPVDNSDPRAGEFLRASMIVDEMNKIISIPSYSANFTVKDLSIELLNFPDGYVQEKALELMAKMPDSSENVTPVLTMLEEGYDAKLMKQALIELKKYPNSSAQQSEVFINILETGSIYAGQTLANEILPFLNSDNIDSFNALLQRLPAESKKAKALKANIFEYQMIQTGG